MGYTLHGHVFLMSCLTDFYFVLGKSIFCRKVPLYQHCNSVSFAGQLSDRIKKIMKFSAGQNEMLLVLCNRPALFAKTEFIHLLYIIPTYQTSFCQRHYGILTNCPILIKNVMSFPQSDSFQYYVIIVSHHFHKQR